MPEILTLRLYVRSIHLILFGSFAYVALYPDQWIPAAHILQKLYLRKSKSFRDLSLILSGSRPCIVFCHLRASLIISCFLFSQRFWPSDTYDNSEVKSPSSITDEGDCY